MKRVDVNLKGFGKSTKPTTTKKEKICKDKDVADVKHRFFIPVKLGGNEIWK